MNSQIDDFDPTLAIKKSVLQSSELFDDPHDDEPPKVKKSPKLAPSFSKEFSLYHQQDLKNFTDTIWIMPKNH